MGMIDSSSESTLHSSFSNKMPVPVTPVDQHAEALSQVDCRCKLEVSLRFVRAPDAVGDERLPGRLILDFQG
jgi:hypothetical protein